MNKDRYLYRYICNWLHNGLVHPLMAFFFDRTPKWLLRLHDWTAHEAWPQTKEYSIDEHRERWDA